MRAVGVAVVVAVVVVVIDIFVVAISVAVVGVVIVSVPVVIVVVVVFVIVVVFVVFVIFVVVIDIVNFVITHISGKKFTLFCFPPFQIKKETLLSKSLSSDSFEFFELLESFVIPKLKSRQQNPEKVSNPQNYKSG